MPWCDECAKFWNPSSMGRDGTCPTCGRSLDRPSVGLAPHPGDTGGKPTPSSPPDADVPADEGERLRAPWHFKILLLALAIYLGWRLVQLIQWLV